MTVTQTTGVPQRGAMVSAEWTNVRSTPTASALLGGSVVMAAASCVANLAVTDNAQLSDPDTLQRAMHASTVATLVFALVAGLVLSTSDFRFGRIDQLLLGDPKRSRLLRTKAIVGGGLGMVYGLVGATVAVVTVTSFFAIADVTLDLGSAALWRPLLGVVLGSAMFGILGIGVGTAIQIQPAAIAGSLAFMLIVEPTALLGAPSVAKWLPGASGLALTLAPDPNLLNQVKGGILLLAWTSLALAIGNHRLATADVS